MYRAIAIAAASLMLSACIAVPVPVGDRYHNDRPVYDSRDHRGDRYDGYYRDRDGRYRNRDGHYYKERHHN